MRYIEQQYSLLLDRREVLCVEELIIQVRISQQYQLASFAELEYAQAATQMLIKTANQGLSYIERHCRETSLGLDLGNVKANRRSSFTETWPYDVLLPYAGTSGLLKDFEKYNQCRGYEYFVPGCEASGGKCITCEWASKSKKHSEGECLRERKKTGIWVLLN